MQMLTKVLNTCGVESSFQETELKLTCFSETKRNNIQHLTVQLVHEPQTKDKSCLIHIQKPEPPSLYKHGITAK